jgi:hypothetical protein
MDSGYSSTAMYRYLQFDIKRSNTGIDYRYTHFIAEGPVTALQYVRYVDTRRSLQLFLNRK